MKASTILFCLAQIVTVCAATGLAQPDAPLAAFSSDGKVEVHVGAYEQGLVARDTSSLTERAIQIRNSPDCDGCVSAVQRGFIDDLAVSNDGTRIAFNVRWFVTSEGSVYTVKIDGTDLKQAAPANFSTRKPQVRMDFSHLAFSPSGDAFLSAVDLGCYPSSDSCETWVGLLRYGGMEQTPTLIARGVPLMWSKRGDAFYFRDDEKAGSVFRWDIAKHMSALVAGFESTQLATEILGSISGTDCVFVTRRSKDDRANSDKGKVSLVALDGAAINSDLAERAAAIPPRDSDGRYLSAINTTQKAWTLVYKYYGGLRADRPNVRTVQISLQK